jgi:hypothetical protein
MRRGKRLATKRHKRHKKGKEREKGGENAFNYELHGYARMGKGKDGEGRMRLTTNHTNTHEWGEWEKEILHRSERRARRRESGSGVSPLFWGESLATKRHKSHKKGKEREGRGEGRMRLTTNGPPSLSELWRARHEITRKRREEVGIRAFSLHDLYGGLDLSLRLCASAGEEI